VAFNDDRGRKIKTKSEMTKDGPTPSVMEAFFFLFDDRHDNRVISITIERLES
jgi:hypothetical protein